MKTLLDRIRVLIRRDAVLHDIDDELRSHLEMEADANREVGMSDEEADRAICDTALACSLSIPASRSWL